MGRRLVGVIAVVALATMVSSSQSSASSQPSRDQIQLMPLPHATYGSAAAPLGVDASSGWTTNKEASDNDFDPAMTPTRLYRLGRLTGFDVEFDDLKKASTPGLLVDADSSIDLFRTALGATQYFQLEISEFRRFDGKKLQYGLVFDHVGYFTVPGVPGARGIRFRLKAGGLTIWETGVEFRVGAMVAGVGLGRTDDRDVSTEVQRLAVVFSARISGVLAGRVHDKPLTQSGPKLGGLGRPPGGPDLAAMAIQPGDFATRAKPKSQRYVRNTDDVADYQREFSSVTFGASKILYLKVEVELRPTAKSAGDDVALFATLLRGARGRTFIRDAFLSGIPKAQRRSVQLSRGSPLVVQAGDRTTAFGAVFTVSGIPLDFVLCVVQRDRVLETLSLIGGTIRLSDVRKLAGTASGHIDAALH